jgi:hypothetical protein
MPGEMTPTNITKERLLVSLLLRVWITQKSATASKSLVGVSGRLVFEQDRVILTSKVPHINEASLSVRPVLAFITASEMI